MGKPSYEQLTLDKKALKEEVEALIEVNEGLVAQVEAAEAKTEAALFAGGVTAEEINMESVTVVNTRKNRLELCGLQFPYGKEVEVSGDQLKIPKLYQRLTRAIKTGVLEEV